MSIYDEFIDIPLDSKHLHLYPARTAIVRVLRESLHEMNGILLDVGCGLCPYKDLFLSEGSKVVKYVGLDMHDQRSYRNAPDVVWDGKTIPIENCSIRTAVATEVLEHVPEPAAFLREVFRVLEPGGKLFLTVPFFWMLHEVPYDEFRYTPFSLERLHRAAGFGKVHVRPLNGWNASLVQMFANWAVYGDESRRLRAVSRRALLPFFKFLLHRDRVPESFATGQMTTGFFCTAEK